jgi:hypothetical protein
MKKDDQNIFRFSFGFVPSFFFYLCLIIDLSIPLVFFFGSPDFTKFSASVFGDYAGMIIGLSSFLGILIFTFYGFMISMGFPKKPVQSFLQFLLRLLPFGMILFAEDDIARSLFVYGLIDMASITAILSIYLLGHHLFIKDQKKAKKVFSYKGATLWVAVCFGIPLLILSISLFITGYFHLNPVLSIVSMLLWLGMLIPVFYAQFRTMRNYTIAFYSKY